MESKHTKLGIASLILTSAVLVATFALIAIAVVLGQIRNVDHDLRHLGGVLFALCLFALILTNILALGLGIAGLAQPECKKLFAVLGTVLASLQIVLTIIAILANA